MGNRYMSQFQYTLEKDTVTLFGSVVIGAAGAVQTVKGGGIAGVVKSGTGLYEIEFEDSWSRLLHSNAGIVSASAPNIASIYIKEDPSTLQADVQADKKYKFETLDFAGAAANPSSGTVISIIVVFRKTSIGPFDN
jgi:hypothetical protein